MSDYAWSKSSLKSVLEGCSWQWALRKVYGVEDHGSPQTAMGTGFHKAIEEWENSGRSLSLEDVQSVAAEKAFEECKLLPMSQWYEHVTDPQQVVDYAKESVRLWWEQGNTKTGPIREMVQGYNCLGTEQYWKGVVKYAGYASIHGFVDAVYETEDELIITDLKTASSMRRWPYNMEHNIETAMYLSLAAAAVEQCLLPDKRTIFQYHIVSAKEGKTRVIELPPLDSKGEELLISALTDADTIKRLDAYRPKPDWNLCSPKYCSYFQGCRVDGTLSPYSLTISNVSTHAPE